MNPELIVQNLCTKGYHVIEELFAQEHYQELHTLAQKMYQQGLFRHAKIGRQVASHQNESIRTDQILWLEHNESQPAIRDFLMKIQQLMQLLNESLFLGLYEFETHFANYQPGTYYKMHVDQFAAQKTRKISFVYYLNEAWQNDHGGELLLYDKEQQLLQKVAPIANRLICFNSELPHEVAIAHYPRYSITGWMKTRPNALI